LIEESLFIKIFTMADLEAQHSKSAEDVAKQSGKFKIAGRVVMAMRRFQATLNPKYEYGKRPSDSEPVEVVESNRVIVQPKPAAQDVRTASGRTTSGRTLSGRPNSAGKHHGYKGSLLFRPLASPDTAVSSG
jgi:hypothetical protein